MDFLRDGSRNIANERATKFCSIFRAPLVTRHILVQHILEEEEITSVPKCLYFNRMGPSHIRYSLPVMSVATSISFLHELPLTKSLVTLYEQQNRQVIARLASVKF